MICSFALKKREVPATNFVAFTMFLTVFPCFSAFYTQEQLAPIALRSIAFFKRAKGAICSWRSLQKNDRERFAPIAL